MPMRFMTSLLCGKTNNFQFGAALHRGFGPGEQLVGDRFREIIFAAVGTDLGGDIFKNNGAAAALQGYGSLARGGLTFSTDDAFHENLLVRKSDCQISKFGI
jgi:hypothetical protein